MKMPMPYGASTTPFDASLSLMVLVSVFVFIVMVVIALGLYARFAKKPGDPAMKRHLGTYDRDGWGPQL